MRQLAVPLLLSASLLATAATPKLSFIKSFPGSVPAYCSVEVDKTGALHYKESPTDEQPIKAQLPQSDAAALFAVGPLSEWSVANGSKPVEFPDFTRGKWKTAEPWPIVTS